MSRWPSWHLSTRILTLERAKPIVSTYSLSSRISKSFSACRFVNSSTSIFSEMLSRKVTSHSDKSERFKRWSASARVKFGSLRIRSISCHEAMCQLHCADATQLNNSVNRLGMLRGLRSRTMQSREKCSGESTANLANRICFWLSISRALNLWIMREDCGFKRKGRV